MIVLEILFIVLVVAFSFSIVTFFFYPDTCGEWVNKLIDAYCYVFGCPTESYTATKGKVPYHWEISLDYLASKERYSVKDYKLMIKLEKLAASWDECPCGNLPVTIERYEGGCPKDEKLADLGILFYSQISCEGWEGALDTFFAIDQRAEELIGESWAE